jgi:hypothetical protein
MTPVRELPARPGRSPPRVRKITNHGDKPPFATAVPMAVAAVATARPIYLTQAALTTKPDFYDAIQAFALVVFLTVVVVAMVGPSEILKASSALWGSSPASKPAYTPLGYRGPLSWAWMLAMSTNDW